MRRTGTTRRGALTATGAIAVGAILSGCGGEGEGSARPGAPTAAEIARAVRTERRLRASAARTSLELLARYEHVMSAHPATATGLGPLRDAVRAHVGTLEPDGERSPSPAPTKPRATGARAAVEELADAERRTADAHLASLMEAPPELARLLASIAAAGAAHAYLLTDLAKETSS